MNDTKPWYQSVGVWGAVVGLIGSLLSLLKVQVDPAFLDDLRDWLFSAATLLGAGIALYGRLRASRRIGPATQGQVAGSSMNGAPARKAGTFLLPWLCLAAVFCSASGCVCADGSWPGLGRSPDAAYVTADRATYEAIAPEYSAYVASDPDLSDDERARRDRTVATWRWRLEQAATSDEKVKR